MTQEVQNNQEDNTFDEVEMFGEKHLRWYQIAARNETIQHIRDGVKRICIELPTGAGKTVTASALLNNADMRKALGVTGNKLRVMFIAHKHRLLSQAEQTFAAENNVELIVQSAFSNIDQHVIDAGWDVTVLDECQHESMMTIQLQLEKLGDMPIIGLSATVDRADGTLIKFEKFVKPISREQAVQEGYLAETQLYSFVDAPEKDKTRIIKDILDDYADQMGGTMIFVRTKKEVANIAQYLTSKGYATIALLGQSDKEVDKVLNEFSEGLIQFVVNCNKLGEGIDVRGCTSVIIGRQMGSYPMLNQTIGRAARADSECKVWELINPLSGYNLDTTCIAAPITHKLIYRQNGRWIEEEFDYSTEEKVDFNTTRF